MKRLTKSLRSDYRGNLVYLQTNYDEYDCLQCTTPLGTVVVDPHSANLIDDYDQAEKQVLILIEELRKLGFSPYGCFSCRYFTRSGMQIEAGGALGNCIEGRMTQLIRHPDDFTAMEYSCDAYDYGNEEDKAEAQRVWWESIRKKAK